MNDENTPNPTQEQPPGSARAGKAVGLEEASIEGTGSANTSGQLDLRAAFRVTTDPGAPNQSPRDQVYRPRTVDPNTSETQYGTTVTAEEIDTSEAELAPYDPTTGGVIAPPILKIIGLPGVVYSYIGPIAPPLASTIANLTGAKYGASDFQPPIPQRMIGTSDYFQGRPYSSDPYTAPTSATPGLSTPASAVPRLAGEPVNLLIGDPVNLGPITGMGVSDSTVESVENDIESSRFLSAYDKLQNLIRPVIDFKDPSTFAFYGSAEQYYKDAFYRITETYPYDGSRAERLEWLLSASALDVSVIRHVYPKATGFVNFSKGGAGAVTSTSAFYNLTDNPEYIQFDGGPHPNTRFLPSLRLGNNLQIDGEKGNTVEFWLKKSSYDVPEKREVIFDSFTHASPLTSDTGHGRFLVELTGSSSNPFLLTYLSGTTGFSSQALSTSLTSAQVVDGKWHHYAIAVANTGSALKARLYVDGILEKETLTGFARETLKSSTNVGKVSIQMSGTIGALSVSNGGHGAKGWGKLSGSIDDFRFWKIERNAREIGIYYDKSVYGATIDDVSRDPNLSLYYKFNEGILGVVSTDRNILDYSGRIGNGLFIGYSSDSRDSGSGITQSDSVNNERSDPVIYEELTTETLQEYIKIGRGYDRQNHAALAKSVPQWAYDANNEGTSNIDSQIGILVQAMASEFDSIKTYIDNLMKIKSSKVYDFSDVTGSNYVESDDEYLFGCSNEFGVNSAGFEDNSKLAKIQLLGRGFNVSNPEESDYSDVSLSRYQTAEEIFYGISDPQSPAILFEQNTYDIKNKVLKNIYRNLNHILKSKGTESSYRNLIRCFGVDEDLIRLNVYANNEERDIIDEPVYKSINKKTISFEGTNKNATLMQTGSSVVDSRAYMIGTNEITPWTVEGSFIFPKQIDPSTTIKSSLFGASTTGLPYPAADQSQLVFNVSAVKYEKNDSIAYFKLTSSAGLFTEITSSYYPQVYNNSNWNLAVIVSKESGIPLSDIDTDGYKIEFIGKEYDLDTLRNSFHITSSITQTNYEAWSKYNKSFYMGAERQNLTGTVLTPADTRGLFLNVWTDKLSHNEIRQHAINPDNYGRENPQFTSKHNSGSNDLNLNTLALSWRFDNNPGFSTETDPGGEASITIGLNSGFTSTYDAKKLTIEDASGVSKSYIFDDDNDQGATGALDGSGNVVVQINGMEGDKTAITNELTASIEASNGHNGSITVTTSGSPLTMTLIQTVAGTAGNTTVLNPDTIADLTFNGASTTNGTFTGGTEGTTHNVIEVIDFSSGSADDTFKYGDVVGVKHPGKSRTFTDTDKAIKQDHLSSIEYVEIDNAYTSDRVKIKDSEIDKFKTDSRPITYTFSFEKSMYQIISKEMLNFVAGVVSFNNMIGDPVNKYRPNYKSLEKVRERFFTRVQNDMDLDKFVNYYKWIDASLGRMLYELQPASSNLMADLKNIVESHALERNKYKHQFPTLEFKTPSLPVTPFLGVNELLYDWEHGHFSEEEDKHCLWQRTRAERDNTLERNTLNEIITKNVEGATFALRSLSKPYKFAVDRQEYLLPGSNRKANKIDGLYKLINDGKQITINVNDIYEFKQCNDVIQPNKKKIYTAKTDTSGTDGPLDADADLVLPFTLHSSSVGVDFSVFKEKLAITNNHDDEDSNSALQGPFTRAHVGGMPHRRVPFGTADKDRPEAYDIDATSTVLTIRSTTNKPKSMFHRNLAGARFINIANIKHTTSSLLLGNYNKDYEIVMTNGRTNNNAYLTETGGSYLADSTFASSQFISGVMDFAVPDRGRTGHVILNLFSAPGGPETAGAYGRDRPAGEYSVYNTMNYRNQTVRSAEDFFASEPAIFGGYRSGSTQQGSSHKTNRNPRRFIGFTGSTANNDKVFDNFFVQHPIPQNDYGYSWIRNSVQDDVYAFLNRNANVGHQHMNHTGHTTGTIRSEESILFLTHSAIGSATRNNFGADFYFDPGLSYGAGGLQSVPSSTFLDSFIPVDFAGLNTIIFEPIDETLSGGTNTLGYATEEFVHTITFGPGSPLGNTRLGYIKYLNRDTHRTILGQLGNMHQTSVSDFSETGHVLNSIIHHRQGPYGWPSWKQIRGGNHPIIRNHRKQNIFSIVRRGSNFNVSSLMDYNFSRLESERRGIANKLANDADDWRIPTEDVMQQTITEARSVKNYKDICVTGRFNPLTMTKHNFTEPTDTGFVELRALVSHGGVLDQVIEHQMWNADEYYYEQAQGPEQSLGLIVDDEENPFSFDNASIENIRRVVRGSVSLRISFQNELTTYANQEIAKDLQVDEVRPHRFESIYSTWFPESRKQRRDRREIRELNYIETLYPKEVNTYTKNARTREGFIFHGYDSDYDKRIYIRGDVHDNASGFRDHFLTDFDFTQTRPLDRQSRKVIPLTFPVYSTTVSGSFPDFRAFPKFGTNSDIGEEDHFVHSFFREVQAVNMSSTSSIGYARRITASAWPLDAGPFEPRGTTFFRPMMPGRFGFGVQKGAFGTGRTEASTTVDGVTRRFSSASSVVEIGLDTFDTQGQGGQGLFQNDYGNWPNGLNLIYGTPPPSIVYNRRTLQLIPFLGALGHQAAAGEARWSAADKKLGPFYNSYEDYSEKLRLLGQDHSLVPEFRISDFVEKYYDLKSFADVSTMREGFLSLTGAIYQRSSDKLQVGSQFFKTYGTSDFMKYFGAVAEKLNADDSFDKEQGDMVPTRLTLRCQAAMKFLPYRGFYPAERIVQLGEIFANNYMKSGSFQSFDTTFMTGGLPTDQRQTLLEAKIRASKQQAMKLIFGPGILMNSIKSGLAVDYPMFAIKDQLPTFFILTHGAGRLGEIRSATSKIGDLDNNNMLINHHGILTRLNTDGATTNSWKFFYGEEPLHVGGMTGSVLNASEDGGVPRLSGSLYSWDNDHPTIVAEEKQGRFFSPGMGALGASFGIDLAFPGLLFAGLDSPAVDFPMKRYDFNNVLNIEDIYNERLYDNEPHPSQSLLIGNRLTNMVIERPFRFGSLNDYTTPRLIQKTFQTNREAFSYAMLPFKSAFNNFAAETVSFFLENNTLSTLLSEPIKAQMVAGKSYRMRVHIRNNDTMMYDRHSAFGPACDANNTFRPKNAIEPIEVNQLENQNRAGNFNVSYETASFQHGHLPYVPPYLDINSDPFMEFEFNPPETKFYNALEIVNHLTKSSHNISKNLNADYNMPLDSHKLNLSASMSVSGSLNLDTIVRLERDKYLRSNPFGGDNAQAAAANPDYENFGYRWAISPQWETPLHDFSDVECEVKIVNRSTGVHTSNKMVKGSPYRTRGTWDNYFIQNPTSSLPILTSSTGMWHQYGVPATGSKGYYLDVSDVGANGLASILGFLKPSNTSQESDGFKINNASSIKNLNGTKRRSLKLGSIADSKNVKESVVAIPYYVNKDNNKVSFFDLNKKHLAKAKRLNNEAVDRYVERSHLASSNEEIFGIIKEYDRLASVSGPGAVDSIAYQLRMMRRYVLPPFFDFLSVDDVDPFVIYFFEFNAKLNTTDLSNIWQNLYPESPESTGREKYTDPTRDPVGQSDVIYSSHVLDSSILNDMGMSGNQSNYEDPKDFLREDVRWLVFKCKFRAVNDFNFLRKQSIDPVHYFNKFRTRNSVEIYGDRGAVNLPVAYNWPYDYFSFVELIKLESKVDFYGLGYNQE